MATVVKSKNGNPITLLNPSEKAGRFASQMKAGEVAETGKKLTGSDYAFRAGYLQARKDSAKAYKHNKKKK